MPVRGALNVAVPKDHGQFGARQRYRAHVPSPSTTLILGERWKDDPPLGYNGATLHTVENMFVDVLWKTLVQLKDNVIFQTPANWTHYVTGRWTNQAAGTLSLSSATQLVLASLPDTGHSPPVGADLQEIYGESIPDVATFHDLRDTFADDQTTRLNQLPKLSSALGTAKTNTGYSDGAAPIDAMKAVLDGDTAALKEGADASVVGMSLAAATSVFVSTPKMFDVHADAGINLMAGGEAVSELKAVSTGDLFLRSGTNIEATAVTNVTAIAGANAEVSAMSAATFASRTATAEVLAPTIQIGNQAPGSVAGASFIAGTQMPTNNITVAALTDVTVDSKATINVDAVAKVEIKVGLFTITVTPLQCEISSGIMGSLVVDPISVTLNGGPVDAVTAKVGGCSMESPAASVETQVAQVKIKAPQIKLG